MEVLGPGGVERRGDHPAPGGGDAAAEEIAAPQVTFEELNPGDIVDGAAGRGGAGVRPGDLQIEGLLAVVHVAAGHVAADAERGVDRSEVALEGGCVDSDGGEDARLDRVDARGGGHGRRA